MAETFRPASPEQTAEKVTVAGSGQTVTDVVFTLDVAGNVVAQTDGGDTTTFAYFGDQLQSIDPPDGPRSSRTSKQELSRR